MKLYYFKDANGFRNFGDDLNPWLWEKFMPGVFDDDPRTIFIGFGTILSHKIPSGVRKVVFSAGVGYGQLPKIDDTWKIYCLRGPFTAQKLNVPLGLAVTDGAILTREFVTLIERKKYKISYMPFIIHAMQGDNSWNALCTSLGFNYIDPQWPVEKIISLINNTECLITESLHGAIVADALRVPWVPVIATQGILKFKWEDWCASIGVKYIPRLIFPFWALKDKSYLHFGRWLKSKVVARQLLQIAKNPHSSLSSEYRLNQLILEFKKRREQFRMDVEAGVFL